MLRLKYFKNKSLKSTESKKNVLGVEILRQGIWGGIFLTLNSFKNNYSRNMFLIDLFHINVVKVEIFNLQIFRIVLIKNS